MVIEDEGNYIQHHLTYLQLNLHNMKIGDGGFFTLNLDTFILSVLGGALISWVFYRTAKKFSIENPSKIQILVEIIFEQINKLVKEIFRGKSELVAPLALSIFVWVFLLNLLDLIPVDILPTIASYFGAEDFRSVPTDDPNLTFALSISVFLFIIFSNFKAKGREFIKEILFEPFGKVMVPVNITFRLIEEIVKPISLSLRLFGNIFSGELIFLLIAALPWWIEWAVGGVWSIFHLFVVAIQAFIFMMLTVIYVSMAHESSH